MSNFLIGKKIGMTQIYDDSGILVGVTVIEAGPCPVVSVMDKKVQIAYEEVNEKKLSRPVLGIYKKAAIRPRRVLKEVPKNLAQEYTVGHELKVDMFNQGEKIDVQGLSIGKGFQGGMKRWHWSGGPKSHGSTSHRRIGSLGSSTTPGRVWKGHHLPGHMGNKQVTIYGLKVIKVDAQNNLLAVKGSVPGCKNNYLLLCKTSKFRRQVIKPVIAEQKAESLKKDSKRQASSKK